MRLSVGFKREFILLPIILFSCLGTKKDNRLIHIKTIGWQFRLSSSTVLRDSSFNKNGEVIAPIPSDGPSLRLLIINDSTLGFFGAYLRKDTLDSAAWHRSHELDTKWYFEEMKQISKYTILDTNYSTQKVGGINFLVQYVKFIRKNTTDTGHVYHYYGKIKNNELDISFEFYNNVTGKKYLEIINSSKFVN